MPFSQAPAYGGDFIKEKTTTTTTGNIMLDGGAVTGFATWLSWYNDGNRCTYAIDDGNGNWEVGTGTFHTGTPNYIVRDYIWWSSNGGSATNFTGKKANVYSAPNSGGSNMSIQQHSFGAGIKPTGGSDNTQMFSQGSLWTPWYASFQHRLYICVDATTGAAVWAEILTTFPGNNNSYDTCECIGGYGNNASQQQGAVVVGGDYNAANGPNQVVLGNRNGQSSVPGASVRGAPRNAGSTAYGKHQHLGLTLAVETTTNAATAMLIDGTSHLNIPATSAYYIKGQVLAYDNADNLTSCWDVAALVRADNSGTCTIVNSSVTMVFQDAGAAAWAVAISRTALAIDINVTGATGKTIEWTAELNVIQASL